MSYLTSLKKVCTFILPYSDSLSNSTSSFLLCPWSCLSHLHPLFSLNLTSYDPLQFFPFLFPSFSPPLLNPPDSHCNLVINVFSDKKKKKNPTPSLSGLYQSFTSLSHRSRKSEHCADDGRFNRVETNRAFCRHTRAFRWLCLSLTSFRPH